MSVAFRVLGAAVAAVTAFIGIIFLGVYITGGSAWMLAFIPLAIATSGAIVILALRGIDLD